MNNIISIIVPCYNIDLYLKRCVDSLINQSYKDIEIILVDDGSTDNTSKICDDYKTIDSRIKVVHKKNGGLSSARNCGILNATGAYLLFVDSDDFVDKNICTDLYKDIRKHNADMSIGNRYTYYNEGKKFLKFKEEKDVIIMDKNKAMKELLVGTYYDMSSCGKLFKRELFNNISFPNGKYSEDCFVMYQLIDLCDRITYNSKGYYYYYQRIGSISKNKKISFDLIEAAKNQMNFIDKKYTELSSLAHYYYSNCNMTIYNIHIKNKVKCDRKKELQKNVRDNLKIIMRENFISRIKKIQCYFFTKNIYIYRFLFKLYKRVDKS